MTVWSYEPPKRDDQSLKFWRLPFLPWSHDFVDARQQASIYNWSWFTVFLPLKLGFTSGFQQKKLPLGTRGLPDDCRAKFNDCCKKYRKIRRTHIITRLMTSMSYNFILDSVTILTRGLPAAWFSLVVNSGCFVPTQRISNCWTGSLPVVLDSGDSADCPPSTSKWYR